MYNFFSVIKKIYHPSKVDNSSFQMKEINYRNIVVHPQGLGASEIKGEKILYNTTRGRTHLLPFFKSSC